MTEAQFVSLLRKAVPVGTTLDNPGGGTSTILSHSTANLSYGRARSRITVAYANLFDAYTKFKGLHVSSSDLKSFMPLVFDSHASPAGHACNCTVLFRILETMNLCGPISGRGVRGNPFGVDIRS